MKRLIIDIETSPNLAHVWKLWKENVSLAQLQESGEVIAFAAKWHGESRVEFRSNFHDGHESMILRAHELMTEADAIITWNGVDFDIPWLHTEFLGLGLTPPAPHKDIDLLKVARKRFRLPSYKLDYVAQRLGVGGKVSHIGHELWVRCLAGDPKAWAIMKRYNRQDVVITDGVYEHMLPWIPGHPHPSLYDSTEDGPLVDCCQRCGSEDLEKRGYAFTNLGKYQQYQCRVCGSWSRGKKALAFVNLRGTQ